MDKKSGRGMRDYSNRLKRMLDNMTPWDRDSRMNALRHKYGKHVSGDERVFVLLGAGEAPDHPLYKDAKVVKEAKKG